jgi:hypothetical protein
VPKPELIKQKLDEYGIEVVNRYDCNEESYFVTDDMIICYRGEADRLAISFDAGLIPERVANNIMILQEIEGLNHDFEIMDSFRYGVKQKFVTGKEAHEAVIKSIESEYQRKEEMFQKLFKGDTIGTA